MRTTTFRPTAKATHFKEASYTLDGRATFEGGVEIGIGVVKLAATSAQTSVRTDTSGSQSRAEETSYDARFLVHPDAQIKLGHILGFAGMYFRIAEIHQRYEMTGDLNHYQVDLIRWQASK